MEILFYIVVGVFMVPLALGLSLLCLFLAYWAVIRVLELLA